MAKPVVITADSTCDLAQELIERYDIRIGPADWSRGGTTFTLALPYGGRRGI